MAVIGVQTCGLDRLYGVDGAYREMKAAGFGAADVNLNDHYSYRDIVTGQRSPVFSGPLEESLAVFKPYRDAAEKYGVLNAQAHAPFPSWVAGMEEQNDYLITVLERSVEICGFLGCPRLVVHPFFGGYDESLTAEAEWDLNMDRYARLIPAARKHGVTICLENMFIGHNRKLYQACCSDFTVACRYVDALNALAGQELFGFCLDTGHALLLGKDIRQVIRQLGQRIKCFHLHDNNGIEDQHLAPYMGVMDWDRFAQGLRDIGYRGHLSFETESAVSRAFDPELVPELLRLIAASGRLFARRAGME